jgi:polyisoprenoid-binding protein YceI
MSSRLLYGLAFGLAAFSFPATAATGSTIFDPALSHMEIRLQEQNVPVSATVRSFSSHVDYDVGDPGAAKASFELEPASLDFGSDPYKLELRKSAWFDTTEFPKARFVSTSVVPGPAGHLDVIGTLTIRGQSRKIRIPLFAGPALGGRLFEGHFDISRREFGLVDPQSDGGLSDRIRIQFHLVQADGA